MSATLYLLLVFIYCVVYCYRVSDGDINIVKFHHRSVMTDTTFNSTSKWIRRRRQIDSEERTRMGKVWIVTNTELPVKELETIASWDVSEDVDIEEDEEFKLTTEKLAYILIGSCCILSIVCLLLVLIGLRCHRKCLERKRKRLESAYYFYPAANCYRIRSYSDAHFYQVPMYNESPPYVYKNYPYLFKQWKEEPKQEKQQQYYQESKQPNKPSVSNSALHEQTLDIRGRKTVKRITVLPPTKPAEQVRRKSKSSSLYDYSPKDDSHYYYSQRNFRSKKDIQLNTLTDSEKHAWLNCIYLLDELHKCHTSTDMSTIHHQHTSIGSKRSVINEQKNAGTPHKVAFSEQI